MGDAGTLSVVLQVVNGLIFLCALCGYSFVTYLQNGSRKKILHERKHDQDREQFFQVQAEL